MLTTGLEDGGRRAAIGLGVALAALSTGTEVHVFLSLEAAVLGTPTGAGNTKPRGFTESLDGYIQHFVELGGHLEICSSCFEEYCRNQPRDADGRVILRPNTEILGLGSVAERATHMPVVTF